MKSTLLIFAVAVKLVCLHLVRVDADCLGFLTFFYVSGHVMSMKLSSVHPVLPPNSLLEQFNCSGFGELN